MPRVLCHPPGGGLLIVNDTCSTNLWRVGSMYCARQYARCFLSFSKSHSPNNPFRWLMILSEAERLSYLHKAHSYLMGNSRFKCRRSCATVPTQHSIISREIAHVFLFWQAGYQNTTYSASLKSHLCNDLIECRSLITKSFSKKKNHLLKETWKCHNHGELCWEQSLQVLKKVRREAEDVGEGLFQDAGKRLSHSIWTTEMCWDWNQESGNKGQVWRLKQKNNPKDDQWGEHFSIDLVNFNYSPFLNLSWLSPDAYRVWNLGCWAPQILQSACRLSISAAPTAGPFRFPFPLRVSRSGVGSTKTKTWRSWWVTRCFLSCLSP